MMSRMAYCKACDVGLKRNTCPICGGECEFSDAFGEVKTEKQFLKGEPPVTDITQNKSIAGVADLMSGVRGG